MSAGIARRQLGVNNTMFILRLPEMGVLKLPIHPDSLVETGEIDLFLFKSFLTKQMILFPFTHVLKKYF